jgi:outer membrane scaffolding protein for murein synthesis (MipA/OmpV family)
MLLLVTGASHAQEGASSDLELEGAPSGPPRDFFSLGAGAGINDLEFTGGNLNTNIIPFINFRKGRFHSQQAGLGFDLISKPSYRLALVAEVGVNGLNRNRVDALDDMESLDLPIYTGLLLEVPMGSFTITGKAQREVGLADDGWRLSGSIARPFRINSKLSLSPSIGIDWQDAQSTNYVYGVPLESVTASRSSYTASDSFKVNAGVASIYRLNDKWTIVGAFGATWYGDEIYDSPIVDQRVTLGSFFALGYSF